MRGFGDELCSSEQLGTAKCCRDLQGLSEQCRNTKLTVTFVDF